MSDATFQPIAKCQLVDHHEDLMAKLPNNQSQVIKETYKRKPPPPPTGDHHIKEHRKKEQVHIQPIDINTFKSPDIQYITHPQLRSITWTVSVDTQLLFGVISNIPEFSRYCALHSLDLHGNLLEGKVPESLGNCFMLEVLNLENNLLDDTFPCFLMNCTSLRVLALRANKLHGDIQCRAATKFWSKLQIIDLASNYFIGHVPRSFFSNWRGMINDGEHSKLNYLQYELLDSDHYVDKVIVVNKGYEIELVKILTIFTSIDFSNNMFSGEIPGSIGELKALHSLNMSHNAFTGSIPASIGNLKQLDSLDLSVNNLAGSIPIELANITFLYFLNLSYNLQEGRIRKVPTSNLHGNFFLRKQGIMWVSVEHNLCYWTIITSIGGGR